MLSLPLGTNSREGMFVNDLDKINLVADLFVAAVTTGSRQGLEQVFDASAVIWHNTDGVEQSAAESINVIIATFRNRPFSYEKMQRAVFPTGFVQQHVITADGGAFEMPACLVVEVKNSKITRINEYYDGVRVAALKSSRRNTG